MTVEKYRSAESLSNSERISAIVEWPEGLSGTLVIYPFGGSAERDEQIRRILKQTFTKLQAAQAGIQNVAI